MEGNVWTGGAQKLRLMRSGDNGFELSTDKTEVFQFLLDTLAVNAKAHYKAMDEIYKQYQAQVAGSPADTRAIIRRIQGDPNKTPKFIVPAPRVPPPPLIPHTQPTTCLSTHEIFAEIFQSALGMDFGTADVRMADALGDAGLFSSNSR